MKIYNKYRRAEDLLEYGRHYKEDLPFNYYDFMADYAAAGPASLYCSQYFEDFLTWCKPCLREFPVSKSLYNELENKNMNSSISVACQNRRHGKKLKINTSSPDCTSC